MPTVHGRNDEPSSTDLLAVEPYVEGLSRFATSCETPLTVAVQGGWGSGKSTVLGLMKSRLERDESEDFVIVEFDAWQSAFSAREEDVLIELITHIIDCVERDGAGMNEAVRGKASALRAVLSRWLPMVGRVAGQAALSAAAAAAGTWSPIAGAGAKAATSEISGMIAESGEPDGAPERLVTGATVRRYFHDFVREWFSQSQGGGRLIVSIDNLDRLRPSRAIEIMECLRAILDAPNCVFLVAVDFDVVILGVQDKYGAVDDVRAREFFDKIIQLPFHMPVTAYDLVPLIENLFDEVSKDVNACQQVCDMARSAVGATPRSIKRLANSYRLLQQIRAAREGGEVNENEVDFQLFSIVCLQVGFPVLYQYLDAAGYSLLQEILDQFSGSIYSSGAGLDVRAARKAMAQWESGEVDDDDDERAEGSAARAVDEQTPSVVEAAELLAYIAVVFRDGDTGRVDGDRLRDAWKLTSVTASPAPAEAPTQPAKKRRTKSSVILVEHGRIPEGERIEMRLETFVTPEVAGEVYSWLDQDPQRREVTWVNDPIRPLKWAVEPDKTWTFSSLRNKIFEMSGLDKPSFSAADCWCYDGWNMYSLAEELVNPEGS